jgi:predicted RNA-binding protein (virulence factor B family)
MVTIGKRHLLSVVRAAAPGLYLDGGPLGEILLPGRLVPRDVQPKTKIDVFVYLDSEDRLVATTEVPKAMVNEFADLRVVSVNPRVGAFLDWGLAKDLLVPFSEQEFPMRPGQNVIAYVYLDNTTRRIVASTRINRFLNRDLPGYADGEAVDLLIMRRTPLGYNAIVNHAHRGLLYHDNLSAPLQSGQRLKGFVRTIRPGGKIDLTLDASGFKRVAPLKGRIIDELKQNQGRLNFDDNSSPESIREKFGVSKKAFKQALGGLYKSRQIRFGNPGIHLVDEAASRSERPLRSVERPRR